jgi:hypothetical protein
MERQQMPLWGQHTQFDFPKDKDFYKFYPLLILQGVLWGYRHNLHIKKCRRLIYGKYKVTVKSDKGKA